METFAYTRSVSAKPEKQFASAFWNSGVSLHDCLATAIEKKGGDLIFTFEDGFWIFPEDPAAPVYATNRSAVVFHLSAAKYEDQPEVVLYERTKKGVCLRELPFSVFMERVHSGEVFEFVNQYFNYNEVLFRGSFGSAQTFRDCACDLRMWLTGVDFCWNGLNRERRW